MQIAALVIVTASGLWLMAVAAVMALRPSYCLYLFEKITSNLAASNWRVNLMEQGLRIVAGTALIFRAPLSKLPLAFEVSGWCIVISSLFILAVPIRWHASYGAWWSRWLTPLVIRLLSPIPAIVGAGTIHAAI